MSKQQESDNQVAAAGKKLSDSVDEKVARKLRAKKDRAVWFGLGTFGLIGWSVAVPTLLGIALGVWIDRSYASRFSWTLMLMFAGLVIGCLNAWYWLKREGKID